MEPASGRKMVWGAFLGQNDALQWQMVEKSSQQSIQPLEQRIVTENQQKVPLIRFGVICSPADSAISGWFLHRERRLLLVPATQAYLHMYCQTQNPKMTLLEAYSSIKMSILAQNREKALVRFSRFWHFCTRGPFFRAFKCKRAALSCKACL